MPINLKVRDRDGERVIEMMQDKATIGRSSECTVTIEDTMASREHCRIEKVSDSEFKLVDLESRNGTRVNGIHVNQHKLGHGDQIQIGEVTVVFDHPGLAGAKSSGKPAGGSSGKAPSGQKKPQSGTRSKHSTRRVARRRGKGAGNELAIVGAIAVLVISVGALAMIAGGGGSSEMDPARVLARAQKYLDEGELDKAEKEADRIKASQYPKFYEKAHQLKQDIEQQRSAVIDDVQAREADFQFKQVQADETKGKLKGDKLLAAYKKIIRQYPGSLAANRAKTKLASLGTGTTKKDPLADLKQKARMFLDRNEFQNAIELYQNYWEKTGNKQANEQIKEIDEQGDRAYKDLHHRAQAALSSGRKDKAREFYQEVKRSFGGKWNQLADSELSKIR